MKCDLCKQEILSCTCTPVMLLDHEKERSAAKIAELKAEVKTALRLAHLASTRANKATARVQELEERHSFQVQELKEKQKYILLLEKEGR